MRESYLNLKEKYDRVNKTAQDLKAEIIENILSRLDETGESKSVTFSGVMHVVEKSSAPLTIMCNLKVIKVIKFNKARVSVVAEDANLDQYEYDLRILTFRECMNILKILYTTGGYTPISVEEMGAKDIPEEDEDYKPM